MPSEHSAAQRARVGWCRAGSQTRRMCLCVSSCLRHCGAKRRSNSSSRGRGQPQMQPPGAAAVSKPAAALASFFLHTRRQWVVPVKSYLKAGEDNSLTISIKSAFKTSLANKEAYPYHIPTLYVRAMPFCAMLCCGSARTYSGLPAAVVTQHGVLCSTCSRHDRMLAAAPTSALWQQQARTHECQTAAC